MASTVHFRDLSAHLRVDGISASFADRRVLTDISFVVPARSRTALIGENGTGKSTLLRIVAGRLESDAGSVETLVPGGQAARIGLLEQDSSVQAGASVREVVDSAVAHIREAGHAVEQAADGLADDVDGEHTRAYEIAVDTAERLDAWNIDNRIERMLAGLGLGDLDLSDRADALSGGQQCRLALASLLLSTPDILLLDEPTNHLDDAAAAYLVEELKERRAPVLFASHDRAFLDETATELVDLDPSPLLHSETGGLIQDGSGAGIGITRFTGSYSDYLAARKDARTRWEEQYRDEQAQLRKLRASVTDSQQVGRPERGARTEARAAKKFYADRNAKVVARRVNDARSRLDSLEEAQIRKPPAELSFAGIPSRRAQTGATTLLSASRVGVEGRLSPVALTVRSGDQWLITGANGTGKSTLLSVLAGALEPSTGVFQSASRVSIGLLTQHARIRDPHERGPQRALALAYEDVVGNRRASEIPLSQFGLFSARDFNRPLETLSRGQRQRLALAIAFAELPDVLLLDEPTNHLSLLLVTQLEEALLQYPGTVVIASHDRWLRQRWDGQTLEL